jgi:hypothetical protein
MAKTFDTTEYEFSHGKRPRGYGSWGFQRLDGDPNVPADEYWRLGTYTEAKRNAPEGRWKVLP